MKKFTKLFLSSALVAAMALTSVVAFADGETQTNFNVSGTELKGATYSTETGELTVPAELLVGRDSSSQATFLVYEKTSGAITQEAIVGIDQTDAATFAQNGLKGKPQLPDEGQTAKTYTVKVGYYKSGTFTILSGDLKIDNAPSVLYGQVTLGEDGEPDATINYEDAILVLQAEVEIVSAEKGTFSESQLANAKIVTKDADGLCNYEDAIDILKYEVEMPGTELYKLRAEAGLTNQFTEE